MTLLSEVGELSTYPEVRPLHRSKIWRKPVESITPTDLLISFKRLTLNKPASYKRAVKEAIDAALTEVHKEYLLGTIDSAPMTAFRWPDSPMIFSELLAILNGFGLVERQAILFALSTERDLDSVVRLKRREALSVSNPFAASILRVVVPHLHCNFLFWTLDANKRPRPLLGLEDKFARVAKMSWGEFKRRCRNIVITDDTEAVEMITRLALQ